MCVIIDERDLETLKFLYERLIYVHDERSNYDYMLKLKNIILKGEK